MTFAYLLKTILAKEILPGAVCNMSGRACKSVMDTRAA